MSHGGVEPGRSVLYTLPTSFRDILRSSEFSDFFQDYKGTCFSVRTLDGWSWTSSRGRVPQFTAIFESREVLDSIIAGASEAALGRLFLEGNLELVGNTIVLLSIAQFTIRHSDGLSRNLIQTITRVIHDFSRKLIPVHRASGQQNWHYSPCPLHLPESFFEPWLGSMMGHSYSWFEGGANEFESAQVAALDRACAWLELDRDDWLLDIGCGWGSLILHAAQMHGTHARGITSNELQATTTARRIQRVGLDSLCTVEHRDMRLRPFRAGGFDKVAHLGIFEQVGSANLAEFLRCTHRLLAPGGLVLLHRMTNSQEACITSLPSEFFSSGISRELEIAERYGFDLLRVESLQKDYEQTLRVWIDHLLNANQGSATRLYSTGYRAWMLYLIEILTCLNAGEANVYRVLLKRRT